MKKKEDKTVEMAKLVGLALLARRGKKTEIPEELLNTFRTDWSKELVREVLENQDSDNAKDLGKLAGE